MLFADVEAAVAPAADEVDVCAQHMPAASTTSNVNDETRYIRFLLAMQPHFRVRIRAKDGTAVEWAYSSGVYARTPDRTESTMALVRRKLSGLVAWKSSYFIVGNDVSRTTGVRVRMVLRD